MSVLIKGMETPFSCLVCPCSGIDNTDDGNEVWVCEASKLRQLTVEDKIVHRPEWCPLVPVPYHGDLIDREAWKKSLIDEGETMGIDGFSIDGLSADDICYAIENAPVIIPAERREEDDS